MREQQQKKSENMQTIRERPNGERELIARNGAVLGPFRLRETVKAAARMLDAFDAVDDAMPQVLNAMAGAALRQDS